MVMSNGVQNLTLDTLANREDFPTVAAYTLFSKAVNALDRFYKDQLEYTDLGDRYPEDLEDLRTYRQSLRDKPRGRARDRVKRILVTIGWYENQSQDNLMKMRNVGVKGVELIEALIERKYQDRYED